MSDDAPSSSAAPIRDSGDAISSANDPPATGGQRLRDCRRQKKKTKKWKKRNEGLRKKLDFITDLLKGLDTLVFAELSALYYMECSFFRLLIRGAAQLMYLSPKDETIPFHMPASRLHVVLLLLPNIWCTLVHAFSAVPQAKEYHRGYMHGGMVIDFVGQKPPAYRAYYLLADLLLLLLQFFMLAVHTEREKLRVLLKTFGPLASEATLASTTTTTTARTIEELDAEERGMPAMDTGQGDATDDIELQPLPRSSHDLRRTDTGDSNQDVETSRGRTADILDSGNATIGEYHIIQCIKVAATETERTTAQSLQSIGYRATLAAIDARRRGVPVQRRVSTNTNGA